jgi:hypothetical protein
MSSHLSRRNFLKLTSVGVLFGGSSGCLGNSPEGIVTLTIVNQDDEQHTIDIEFRDGTGSVFTEQYLIPPSSTVSREDVVAPGDYTVIVEVDSSQRKKLEFSTSGCGSNGPFIQITGEGELVLRVSVVCD